MRIQEGESIIYEKRVSKIKSTKSERKTECSVKREEICYLYVLQDYVKNSNLLVSVLLLLFGLRMMCRF